MYPKETFLSSTSPPSLPLHSSFRELSVLRAGSVSERYTSSMRSMLERIVSRELNVPTIELEEPVKDAIITAGGVKTGEIDPGTMMSKRVPGLFFAGEIIDVDAYTGGFNLQIAWSTAVCAANNA